ncbi:MAG: serine--tRNA ligase, partial [Planctomycetota bacterium]
MLDRKFILQNPELVTANSERRGVSCDVNRIVELETQRIQKLRQAEDLNRQANETSKGIGKAKDNDERQVMIARGRELREQKDQAQSEHDALETEIVELQTTLPNLTHP